MNIEFYIAVGVWAALLFVWLPIRATGTKCALNRSGLYARVIT